MMEHNKYRVNGKCMFKRSLKIFSFNKKESRLHPKSDLMGKNKIFKAWYSN